MKLVSNNRNPARCKALTSKGSQCARSAVEKGYCSQHLKLAIEQGKVVNTSGSKPLTEVPDPPFTLGKRGNIVWRIYCQQMIDEKRLFQSYLYGLADLCDMEDQLEEVRQDMRKHGYVNYYDSGVQVNGYSSRYDKLLSNIRSLRADYRLTDAKALTPASGKKESKTPPLKSAKQF